MSWWEFINCSLNSVWEAGFSRRIKGRWLCLYCLTQTRVTRVTNGYGGMWLKEIWRMGNGGWEMDNEKWRMGNGGWEMENGKRRMGNGEWETENGKRRMGGGKWLMENRERRIGNRESGIGNGVCAMKNEEWRIKNEKSGVCREHWWIL